jgi:hypothetical protein
VPVLVTLTAGEIGCIVDVGEGLVHGDRDPEKHAQLLPPFFNVEDEEPLRGDRGDDLAMVPSQAVSLTVRNPFT